MLYATSAKSTSFLHATTFPIPIVHDSASSKKNNEIIHFLPHISYRLPLTENCVEYVTSTVLKLNLNTFAALLLSVRLV